MEEDDKPVKPTNLNLLYTIVEMICANYFPDMGCVLPQSANILLC
jgi:hypothetical protein